jgi:hypothetical protein
MAIQYYMRGYNTANPGAIGYVDWVVNNVPDSTGAFLPAPYLAANVTNITINDVVTSKVDNFLNPFESTTISVASNGAVLPQAVINVVSTTMFPPAGTFYVTSSVTSPFQTTVTYTGKTATSFTGCTGGTGTLATGYVVTSQPLISNAGTTLGATANYTNPVDPYFLHLNSYDWLHPIPPNLPTALPPPNQPIGIAVVRGTTGAGSAIIDLGAASSFGALASSTVTNIGFTNINGDVGVSPGTAITGFPPGAITGAFHSNDLAAQAAQTALTAAFIAGNALPGGTVISGDIGGQTLNAGIYTAASSIGITGTLTLDAQGNPNASWVFQIGSTLTTAAGNSTVVIINGGVPANVFWLVGSSATLGTGTTFRGNILAQVSITATTGANVTGRLLAQTGAVTMDDNQIVIPPAPIPSGGTTLRSYAALFWDESLTEWIFAYINPDGSIGALENVATGSLNVIGHLGVQDTISDPEAATGIIRLPNNQFIKARNSTNTGDVTLIGADNNTAGSAPYNTNRVQVGSATDPAHVPGPYIQIDNFVIAGSAPAAVAQTTGFIRLANNTVANAFRNVGGTLDLAGISSTAGDLIVLGDINNKGMSFRIGSSVNPAVFNYAVNAADIFDIIFNTSNNNTTLSFAPTDTAPTLTQVSHAGSGQTLAMVAQASTANQGGAIVVQSGHGPTADGYVDLGSLSATQIHLPSGGSFITPSPLPMLRAFPNVAMDGANSPSDYRPYGANTTNDASTISFNPIIRFPQIFTTLPKSNLFGNGNSTGAFVAGPVIAQDDLASGTAQSMIISAQWSTSGGVARGGNITITGGSAPSGTGTGVSRAGGNVILSPGVGSGSVGSQTQGEIDFQNAGVTKGRFYVDGYSLPITLGAASSFGVLAGSTITNTVTPTSVTGDIGVAPGSAITGFPPGTFTGTSHSNDAAAIAAQVAVTSAFTAGNALPGGIVIPADIGGMTLFPGIYKNATSVNITGTVILDGQGNPNASWIFQIGSTFGPQNSSVVSLINGANAANVFWLVGSSATLGTSAIFNGNILAQASITANTLANITGRLLAQTGAVTLDNNQIIVPAGGSGSGTNVFFEVGTGSNPAQSGNFRTPNATQIIGARKFNNLGDINVLSTDLNDNVILGNVVQNTIIGGTAANNISNPANTTTTVAGNLLVLGTTTTVDSVTVDIVGRVIHANWTDPVATPNFPVPTQIAGYSVHRGNVAGVGRNGAAILWTEGALTSGADGYWRFATIPSDVDTIGVAGLANILDIMVGSVIVASTPNPSFGTIPGVGGLRTQNNTIAVSARDAAGIADLLLLGSDGSDHILHDISGQNNGQIFNTSLIGIYDFQIGGLSQVQIQPSTIVFPVGVLSPAILQLGRTDGYSGQSLTIEAQNSTGTGGIGGNLNLTSGFGAFSDGYVNLQAGSVTVASVGLNKFIFNQGRRRHVTQITGDYSVLATDDFIAITILAAPLTITLPSNPTLGDSYEIKDTIGNAGVSNVTISGNGSNIDGIATFTLTQPFAAVTLTYTGTQWSIT